jgi:hypothetical protein
MNRRWGLLAVVAASAMSACSVIPARQPVDVVRSALAGIAAHDLAGSSLLVCFERRDANDFPLSLSGIFEAVGAMPGFDVPRTLSVIDVDVSRLMVVESSRQGATAEVAIDGVLVERFDPAKVEALFRAYASETGELIEQDLLDQTLANVSGGPVEIEIHETVPVVRQNDAWLICPPAPTP